MERKVECEFLSRLEVIKYLGISKDTFYEHFAHKLDGYLVGKRIKYKKEDVDKLIRKV